MPDSFRDDVGLVADDMTPDQIAELLEACDDDEPDEPGPIPSPGHGPRRAARRGYHRAIRPRRRTMSVWPTRSSMKSTLASRAERAVAGEPGQGRPDGD